MCTALFYNSNSEAFLSSLDFFKKRGPSREEFLLNNMYRSAESDLDFEDLSFIIQSQGKAIALILAHKSDNELRFENGGVVLIILEQQKKVLKFVCDVLFQLAKNHGCEKLLIHDDEGSEFLSPVGKFCLSLKAKPVLTMRAQVDLTQSIENIRRGLRKSYKPLINKGLKELKIKRLTAKNIRDDDYWLFQKFHKEVAGRQTRPLASWEAHLEMIKAGSAELLLAYLKSDKIVSSALYTDYGNVTHYAIGVYDRTLFQHPLAHPLVYQGILNAKMREKEFFMLGEVPSYSVDDDKEYNIGLFKKGFCDEIKPVIDWSFEYFA